MIRLIVLLLVLAAAPVRAAELKLATWNLNWLTQLPTGDPALPDNVQARNPADWAALAGYAQALSADVVALQEVDGPAAAAKLFPPDRYVLIFTHDQVVQRVGFAVRRDLLVQQNPDLTALDIYPNAQFRLRSGADITLDFPGGKLRLLAVHLKSGCNRQRLANSGRSCDTLRQQITALQGWMAQRVRDGVPFVMLGDFNRRMDGRDEMLEALQATAPIVRVTEGKASPCWGGNSFIDHIFAGGAARAWMLPDTMRVLVYKEAGADMMEHLSDHCPVSVRFRLPD